MYENDLSNGLISGEMTFESYGADKAVTRNKSQAFFKRLAEKGGIQHLWVKQVK